MIPRSAAASGKRDKLVQMVPVTQAVAGSRYPIETDGTPIEVWAAKEELSGRERLAMNQAVEAASYDSRWIVPFSDAWDPDVVKVPKVFWLTHRGRRYDIVHAEAIGRRSDVALFTVARNG